MPSESETAQISGGYVASTCPKCGREPNIYYNVRCNRCPPAVTPAGRLVLETDKAAPDDIPYLIQRMKEIAEHKGGVE